MNIGEAAAASGISEKTIRHYENRGFIPAAGRSSAGYRIYRASDVHMLRFIRRGRELGFSLKDIKQLLGLWTNQRRSSAEVKRLAERHLGDLDTRLAKLDSMRRTLLQLALSCRGDERPDCPILDDLAGER